MRGYLARVGIEMVKMKRITIDASLISDCNTFHEVFKKTFGFPEFYGRNMDAWIDCMSYIDDSEAGMSTVTCDKGDFVVLEILNAKEFKQRCPEQYDALVECSSFVNWRCLEADVQPLLMLSFYA